MRFPCGATFNIVGPQQRAEGQNGVSKNTKMAPPPHAAIPASHSL
jgi:hypothetical protein